MSNEVDTKTAAKFLVEFERLDLIEEALEVYFANGGARFVASYRKAFSTETLLQAALPAIGRVKPGLHKKIVAAVVDGMTRRGL